jgi:hypothetical protein
MSCVRNLAKCTNPCFNRYEQDVPQTCVHIRSPVGGRTMRHERHTAL